MQPYAFFFNVSIQLSVGNQTTNNNNTMPLKPTRSECDICSLVGCWLAIILRHSTWVAITLVSMSDCYTTNKQKAFPSLVRQAANAIVKKRNKKICTTSWSQRKPDGPYTTRRHRVPFGRLDRIAVTAERTATLRTPNVTASNSNKPHFTQYTQRAKCWYGTIHSVYNIYIYIPAIIESTSLLFHSFFFQPDSLKSIIDKYNVLFFFLLLLLPSLSRLFVVCCLFIFMIFPSWEQKREGQSKNGNLGSIPPVCHSRANWVRRSQAPTLPLYFVFDCQTKISFFFFWNGRQQKKI